MFEWIGNAIGTVVDLLTGRGGSSDPGDRCNVGNCLAARGELTAARAGVTQTCWVLSLILVALRGALWVLSQAILTYVVVAIIVFLLGGPIGLLIFFAVIFFAVVTILVILQVLPGIAAVFLGARQREAAAITAVGADCPLECRPDLSPTPCAAVNIDLPSTPFDGILGIGSIRDQLDSLSS